MDSTYWETHWALTDGATSQDSPNSHLVREIDGLVPGSALDAGCGEGAEAIWLATQGWRVTAVDISPTALARAAERAREASAAVKWIEADLDTWQPGSQFDLVTTHYAHPIMPQLDFYERISNWVAPGGTLLIVGHLLKPGQSHGPAHDHGPAHGHNDPPAEVSVTAARVAALFGAKWDVATADERSRTLPAPDGRTVVIDDVVVRAIRRP